MMFMLSPVMFMFFDTTPFAYSPIVMFSFDASDIFNSDDIVNSPLSLLPFIALFSLSPDTKPIPPFTIHNVLDGTDDNACVGFGSTIL